MTYIVRVDGREPKVMHRLVQDQIEKLGFDMEYQMDVLEVGDYACGEIGIERKEEDFIEYEDVLVKAEELKRNYEYPFLFVSSDLDNVFNKYIPAKLRNVDGSISKKKMKKSANSVRGMTSSLISRGVYPIFCSSRKSMVRVMLKTFNKIRDDKDRTIIQPIRPQATSQDRQIHICKAFPKIGSKKAKVLLEEFGNIKKITNAEKEELMEIDGIGKKIAEQIVNVVSDKYE